MVKHTAHAQPPLRVIGYEDEGCFILQCLEYDIAAHGDTPAVAKSAFVDAVLRHILAAIEFDESLFNGVPKAPERFWQMWTESKDGGKQPERIAIPRFTVRRRNDESAGDEQVSDVIAELLPA